MQAIPVEFLANYPGCFSGLIGLSEKLKRPLVVWDAFLAGFEAEGFVELSCLVIDASATPAVRGLWSPVNPVLKIDPKASAYHGLYFKDVKDAPTLARIVRTTPDFPLCQPGALLLSWDAKRFKMPTWVRVMRDCAMLEGSAWVWLDLRFSYESIWANEPNSSGSAQKGKLTIPRACELSNVPYFKSKRVYSSVLSVAALWSSYLDKHLMTEGSLELPTAHITVFQASKTMPKSA